MCILKLGIIGFAGIFLTTVAIAPAAARETPRPVASAHAAEDWTRRLHNADDDLRAGRAQLAVETAGAVLQEIKDNAYGGKDVGSLAGMALLLEAVGQESLGHPEDALWHLQMAESLATGLTNVDLSVYGEPGTRLRDRDVRHAASPPRAADSPPGTAGDQAQVYPIPNVTRPRKLSAPIPEYTGGLKKGCVSGKVITDSIIEKDGRVSNLHLLESANPLLSLAALEALHEWRFEPATLDGHPVRVYYTLTVDFAVRRCTHTP